MMKRKIAAVIMALTVLAGCTAAPALANVDPAAESEAQTEVTESTGTDDAGSEPEIVRNTETGSESDGASAESTEPENNPPLTPAGNLTLVDNVTTSAGTKQFLTLTSRKGNFYYLIIDYDKDGNENVHFLNQIDERDLIGLMDEDEAKELEDRLAEKRAREEAARAELEAQANPVPETEAEPTPVQERVVKIAGMEIPQKTFTAGVLLALFAIACFAGFLILTFRKKPEAKKLDPDADYDEDYGEEIDIPEDDKEDIDFED